VCGGLRLVNFYPYAAAGPTVYIQGMGHGRPGELADALRLARETPPAGRKQRRNKQRSNQRRRRQLLLAKPFCHWCGQRVDDKTSTLDHVIALSRGGSNGSDNIVLACNDCNQRRQNNCTEADLRSLTTRDHAARTPAPPRPPLPPAHDYQI
jgi:hypothetical protein